jgi:hypothetical protein
MPSSSVTCSSGCERNARDLRLGLARSPDRLETKPLCRDVRRARPADARGRLQSCSG